ncbi:MAG TPA: organic solvent ABC transporter permease, partial [Isosphaeraceae bacterium]|nr:organic solvent ABC transporter permease [Isosphaeraceae bacterium]
MWNNPILSLVVLAPLARIGRGALVGITYLGALGTLVGSAIRSVFRPSGECPAFVPATTRQVAILLAMGLPLVGLVHVGLGSFL